MDLTEFKGALYFMAGHPESETNRALWRSDGTSTSLVKSIGIAAVDGAVLDADGRVSARLFAMGPPLRGMWWESTAVTDVAAQAKALAARLVDSLRD